MVKEIKTKAEFDQVLKDAGKKAVFVDFTATWCGPCKMIGPIFVSLADKYPDCVFVKVRLLYFLFCFSESLIPIPTGTI